MDNEVENVLKSFRTAHRKLDYKLAKAAALAAALWSLQLKQSCPELHTRGIAVEKDSVVLPCMLAYDLSGNPEKG